MTSIKPGNDIAQINNSGLDIYLKKMIMVLSKSFGYALRGTLYIASKEHESRKISIEEMATTLGIPKHFLAKIMKQLVKAGIVSSTRGQQGGFSLNRNTLDFPLVKLVSLIEGGQYFNSCLLSLGKCNSQNPCPLHFKITQFKDGLYSVYKNTTIRDLLSVRDTDLIKSISFSESGGMHAIIPD